MHHADANGWTALHEATRSGQLELVKRMLDLGVDKNLPTMTLHTPLNIAQEYLPVDHEMIKYLEGIGAKSHEEL